MKNKERIDLLLVKGRLSLGYGIIPKLAMKDQELTIEAKAIYAYFCSYAGAGTTAFPNRAKIIKDLCISKDRYYKHFNMLLASGYISVEQKTLIDGTFSHNVFTLNDVIQPCPQNKDTVPCPDYPDTENKDTISNKDINNNNTEDNNINNFDIDMTDTRAREENPKKYREQIEKNINYAFIRQHWSKYDIELVNELIEIMLDAICSDGEFARIGSHDKPKELVISRYMSVTCEDIEFVINNFRRHRRKITNISGYLKVMIYNAKQELSHKYENEATVMFYG